MSLEQQLLAQLAPWRSAAAWYVAFSGGLDSSVLLHALVRLRDQHALPALRAIHVHHAMQAVAAAWPAHCQALCDAWDVPLTVVHVQVACAASPEQAARDARYRAFAQVLRCGDCLLTAQHQDDQAETLLFRLLRGAGVRGLAGMPASRALGQGLLIRPLLGIGRAELEDYARQQALSWVEDPSNADSTYDRNYLRQQLLPVITQRWPQAVRTMARSAKHLAEAEGLLGELAQADLLAVDAQSTFAGMPLPSLQLAPLITLSEARQRNLLRYWLGGLTRLPDSAHWSGWESLRDARTDAEPIWRLTDGELRRAHGRLYWLTQAWLALQPTEQLWTEPRQPLHLPDNGQLRFLGTPPSGELRVAYRQGGESLMLPGRGHRDLKKLLHAAALPGFLRDRLPLVWRAEELLAVGLPRGYTGLSAGPWRLHWTPLSDDAGLS